LALLIGSELLFVVLPFSFWEVFCAGASLSESSMNSALTFVVDFAAAWDFIFVEGFFVLLIVAATAGRAIDRKNWPVVECFEKSCSAVL
jgi:hypothetical protein